MKGCGGLINLLILVGVCLSEQDNWPNVCFEETGKEEGQEKTW